MKIKCYSLLSLTKTEIKKILPNADVAGPIARRDLLGDIKKKYNVVIIIDGKFQQSYAVSPSEIMDAIRSGIRVYGSSSMGALRASEMENYGMIGCGKVFDHIKSQDFFRDDLLGQVFEGETNSAANSAYVDFYFNLETLVNKKQLKPDHFEKILKVFAQLHFAERTIPKLLKNCENMFRTNPYLKDVIIRAGTKMGSQKKRDGLELLKKVKKDLSKINSLNARLAKLQSKKPLIHF